MIERPAPICSCSPLPACAGTQDAAAIRVAGERGYLADIHQMPALQALRIVFTEQGAACRGLLLLQPFLPFYTPAS